MYLSMFHLHNVEAVQYEIRQIPALGCGKNLMVERRLAFWGCPWLKLFSYGHDHGIRIVTAAPGNDD